MHASSQAEIETSDGLCPGHRPENEERRDCGDVEEHDPLDPEGVARAAASRRRAIARSAAGPSAAAMLVPPDGESGRKSERVARRKLAARDGACALRRMQASCSASRTSFTR